MPNRTSVRSTLLLVLFVAVAAANCKNEPKPVIKPAAPAVALPLGPEAELKLALAGLPEFVDKDMYKGFFNTAARCQVDVITSSVECGNDYFNNIVKLCERGLMPRPTVLQAASFVFDTGTPKQKVAAAELMFRAYPTNKGAAPDKKVTQKLVAQLKDLPEPVAVDAAGVISELAGQWELEKELFEVLDQKGRERVASAGYRRVMGGARMRAFEKLWDLVASKNMDLAVAAIEAPRAMGGRTVEENTQVCDWMKSLLSDGRAMIEARASAFLAGCGTKYVDVVLAKDEKLAAAGKPLTAGLDAYMNLCTRDVKNPYGNATKAQCLRLKRVASLVLSDPTRREPERVQALSLLADQFPGKETLALATRYTDDSAASLSRKAQSTVRGFNDSGAEKKKLN